MSTQPPFAAPLFPRPNSRDFLKSQTNFLNCFCDKISLEYIKSARLSNSLKEMDELMKKVTKREKNNPLGIFLWPTVPLDAVSKNIHISDTYSTYYDFIPYHLIMEK